MCKYTFTGICTLDRAVRPFELQKCSHKGLGGCARLFASVHKFFFKKMPCFKIPIKQTRGYLAKGLAVTFDNEAGLVNLVNQLLPPSQMLEEEMETLP